MLKHANGRGLSADREAMRLRNLAASASAECREASMSGRYERAQRAIEIKNMLQGEAEAVERDAAL